jgi:glycosyltransferase involved in cell wall biosynthesis
MKLELDKTGALAGTLTSDELALLGRGDRVEFVAMVPHANKLILACDSPDHSESIADLRAEMRAAYRRIAIMNLELHPVAHPIRKDAPGGMVAFDAIVPTVGDSVARLEWLIRGVRHDTRFAGWAPKIILADDACGGFESDKQSIAALAGCEYIKNKDVPGIPGNLNSAIKNATSKWVMIIDDGSSVHDHWIEGVIDTLDIVDGNKFAGRKVAIVGSAHIQDWMARLCGLLTRWPIEQWFHRPHDLADAFSQHFQDKVGCPHKIDFGVIASLWESCSRDRNDDWPAEIQNFLGYTVDNEPIAVNSRIYGTYVDDVEVEVRRAKYLWRDRWSPKRPSAAPLRVNWSPGAQGLLINREFLEECSGFSHDCVGYERLLACKAAEKGWLSLASDYAPYMHMPSLGFVEAGSLKIKSCHRDVYDVCEEIWGKENREPYRVIRNFVTADYDAKANAELLDATRGKRSHAKS